MSNNEKQVNQEELYDALKEEITYEEQNELENELLEVSQDDRKIIWQPKDFTIREFVTMHTDGDLELQPGYQRNYVMNSKQASRLVESVLMDVPLPVIYLAEEKDNTFSVIDGQQRLTSFISFIRGTIHGTTDPFYLRGLKVFPELNRKTFSDLSAEQQKKIRATTLHSIVIKKESNEDIKFEIFERLNTGSIKLNEDEIRNTVYRGSFMDLLADLEESKDFHKLVRKENYKNRMIYRGMILRFFALSEKTYLNYKPSIKQFCNKFLRDNRNMSPEKQKELRELFKHCVDCMYSVFGENSFRRFIPGTTKDHNGSWTTTRINMALFDIQMCGFAQYSKSQIIPKADAIRETMLNLMSSNEEFIDAILIQTSDRQKLQTRFEIWFKALKEIIDQDTTARAFDFRTKQLLFTQDPTCKLCEQQILHIDDAEVDHILPYSKGGKTVIENAQITHRFCNRNKSNNA